MAGVLIVMLIALAVIIVGISFKALKLPSWLGKAAIGLLVFTAGFYLVKIGYDPYELDIWGWFIIILFGGSITPVGIYIYNDLERSGVFGEYKKPASIQGSIPSVFLTNGMFSSNPLIMDANLYSGGKFHCLYAGVVYQIVGCVRNRLDGRQQLHLWKINTYEHHLVDAQYCHLIAKSTADLSNEEIDDITVYSGIHPLLCLNIGVYPYDIDDFKQGIVLNKKKYVIESENSAN